MIPQSFPVAFPKTLRNLSILKVLIFYAGSRSIPRDLGYRTKLQCTKESFPEIFPLFSGKVGKSFPLKMEMERCNYYSDSGKVTGKHSGNFGKNFIS